MSPSFILSYRKIRACRCAYHLWRNRYICYTSLWKFQEWWCVIHYQHTNIFI